MTITIWSYFSALCEGVTCASACIRVSPRLPRKIYSACQASQYWCCGMPHHMDTCWRNEPYPTTATYSNPPNDKTEYVSYCTPGSVLLQQQRLNRASLWSKLVKRSLSPGYIIVGLQFSWYRMPWWSLQSLFSLPCSILPLKCLVSSMKTLAKTITKMLHAYKYARRSIIVRPGDNLKDNYQLYILKRREGALYPLVTWVHML